MAELTAHVPTAGELLNLLRQAVNFKQEVDDAVVRGETPPPKQLVYRRPVASLGGWLALTVERRVCTSTGCPSKGCAYYEVTWRVEPDEIDAADTHYMREGRLAGRSLTVVTRDLGRLLAAVEPT